MKYLNILVMTFLFTNLAFAASKDCHAVGIDVYGQYGKNKAPILDMWSEESGNLTQIEIRKKNDVLKIEWHFLNSGSTLIHQMEMPIVKNFVRPFNFKKIISVLPEFPAFAEIILIDKHDTQICSQKFEIVKRDAVMTLPTKSEK